jgi:hypothetical protein
MTDGMAPSEVDSHSPVLGTAGAASPVPSTAGTACLAGLTSGKEPPFPSIGLPVASGDPAPNVGSSGWPAWTRKRSRGSEHPKQLEQEAPCSHGVPCSDVSATGRVAGIALAAPSSHLWTQQRSHLHPAGTAHRIRVGWPQRHLWQRWSHFPVVFVRRLQGHLPGCAEGASTRAGPLWWHRSPSLMLEVSRAARRRQRRSPIRLALAA